MKSRIVMIHPSAGTESRGGSEVFAVELARRLDNHFEVELLSGGECGPFSRPLPLIPHARSRRWLHRPFVAPLWRPFTRVPELWLEHLTSFLPCLGYLLRRPPAVVFPNNDLGGLAVAVALRAMTGTAVFHTEHCGLLWDGRCLERNLRFKPDRLVVTNERVAERVRKLRPSQALSVIPNGVDLEHFCPVGEREEPGLPRPVVLCVGSLHPNSHKRVELAIEAVARLGTASLLVVGDGAEREKIAALGRSRLGGRFALRSAPHARMAAIYRGADAFTLPSEAEPFGLAYLEAMACGLPVVATDDADRRELVDGGGVLCDVTDADAYAHALARVLTGDWSGRARASALRYGWDRVALGYRDALARTIAPTSPPR